MARLGNILVLSAVLTVAAAPAGAAANWRVALPDTVHLDRDTATMADLAGGPLPANVQELVIRAGLKPNGVVAVSRRDILRRLVTAGLAAGVSFSGAERCHLVFEGSEVTPADLNAAVTRHLQALVPGAHPGAPDSWLEVELPPVKVAAAGKWRVETERREVLTAGRNLVRVAIVDRERREYVTATVTLHRFGEVALVRSEIPADRPLEENLFDWEWRDLADEDRGLVVNRESILGFSSSRTLQPGRRLREADLNRTPLVLAGDAVELQVRRGQVSVTVRAFARQDGCLGQTIPVRNEMTGRLVNARVAGPGIVEWRR